MPDRPNILMLSMDCLRHDALGCTGPEGIRTPNLDRLAGEGTRCERAYCTQPICMPSRSSIMTGRLPSSHGVWVNGVPLREDEQTLPAVLAQAGYRTACYGKFHFRPWMQSLVPDDNAEQQPEYNGDGSYYGFDRVAVVDHSNDDAFCRWVRRTQPELADRAIHPRREQPAPDVFAWKSDLPPEATKTHFIAEQTIAALQQAAANEPFLLWASFIDPHHPYAPPRPWADWYDDVDFPAPPANDGPPETLPAHYCQWQQDLVDGHWQFGDAMQTQWAMIRRMYQGKVSHVDFEIGRILDTLQQCGLAENTIVVFLSDHGCMLGDFGLIQVGPYSMETMVRVPMIWRGPGIAPAQTSQGLCSVMDLMPTLLDFAGTDIPLGVQGSSLRPLLGPAGQPVRDRLIVEQRWGQSPPEGFKTLVTDRYKLSLYTDGQSGELYDLHNDPQELDNRFDAPAARPIREELTDRFARELMLTDNPLPRRLARW